jgi:hypothetical protein
MDRRLCLLIGVLGLLFCLGSVLFGKDTRNLARAAAEGESRTLVNVSGM